LAECELERGDHVQAIQTLGPVEDAFEVGHDPETRARAVGLIARFYLAAGDSDQAAENFQKALDLYGQIGADRRRARLMQAFARQMEGMADPQGKFSAIDMYRSALDVYIHIRDEARIGPAAYSLARCYFEVAEPLRADEAIERALDVCMRRGDMEGLEICTDLGVRIAVAMGQGKLAIRRIEMAARVKAEAGDYEGEVRFLLGALNASLNAPDLDSGHMADTFIESLRRTGTRFLGPAEPVEIAEQLDGAERPEYAKELMALVAAVEVDAGRLSEAAHAFDQAANYAVRADLRDEAGELWDQAIAIGERIRLPMTEDWRINRREFGSA
jgi:tetratricopeptide (TPR) repeat protein